MRPRKLIAFFAAVAITAAACTTTPPEGYEQLTDIAGLDQLTTEFNADQGSPRLILLLSPT